MQHLNTIQSVKDFLDKKGGERLGFVPTMGTLHDGHISLIKASKSENPITLCSIFLNPLQFNNPEDLEKYPRDIQKDIQLLKEAGCDALFMPTYEALFPNTPTTKMSFGALEETMEGLHRPGHFSGVGIIVNKLFNIVEPDIAYFGQKDLQQFAIIRKMVEDLSIDVELKLMPIIREEDGLAMSSRNLRLSPEERQTAPFIHQQLVYASQNIRLKSIFEVKKNIISAFAASPLELAYFEVADPETLQPLKTIKFPLALCIAATLGNVRLIDNVIVKN